MEGFFVMYLFRILVVLITTGCGLFLDTNGSNENRPVSLCQKGSKRGLAIITQKDFSSSASVYFMDKSSRSAYLVSESQSTDVFIERLDSTFAIFNRSKANLNYSIGDMSSDLVTLSRQNSNEAMNAYDPTGVAQIGCSHLVLTNRSAKKLILLNIETNESTEIETSLLKPFDIRKINVNEKKFLVVTSQGTTDAFEADGSQSLEVFQVNENVLDKTVSLTSTFYSSTGSTHPVIVSSEGEQVYIGGPCSVNDTESCTSVIQRLDLIDNILTDLVDISALGYGFEFVEATTVGKTTSHVLLQAAKNDAYFIIELDLNDNSVNEVHEFDKEHRNSFGFELSAFGYSSVLEAYYIGEMRPEGDFLLLIDEGGVKESISFENFFTLFHN